MDRLYAVPLPYANTLTGIVAVPLVLQDDVGSNPTARFVSVFTYGKVFGGVGKLVTPVDCKSAVSDTAGSTPAASTRASPLSTAYNRKNC